MKVLAVLARQIIHTNIYLTLATAGPRPWASPLFYCTDTNHNFYVSSQPHSHHIQNIKKNPRVALAIFDSHAAEGTGNGVQATGRMTQCRGLQLTQALKHYSTTFGECTKEAFTKGAYRLYRITPLHFYILDPQETHIDKRIEVAL